MPSPSQTRKEIITLRFKNAGWNVSARTSHQLQFLNLLRDFLIDCGGIQKRDPIHSPFTIIHPSGIRGVFFARPDQRDPSSHEPFDRVTRQP